MTCYREANERQGESTALTILREIGDRAGEGGSLAHHVLYYLPFAALTDGERYLVDDYTLSYLPSASVLQFIRLIREAATESVVREQAGVSHILHLAAHGVYNPVAPLQSLLALAPGTS